jgi:hypothetical protein
MERGRHLDHFLYREALCSYKLHLCFIQLLSKACTIKGQAIHSIDFIHNFTHIISFAGR